MYAVKGEGLFILCQDGEYRIYEGREIGDIQQAWLEATPAEDLFRAMFSKFENADVDFFLGFYDYLSGFNTGAGISYIKGRCLGRDFKRLCEVLLRTELGVKKYEQGEVSFPNIDWY